MLKKVFKSITFLTALFALIINLNQNYEFLNEEHPEMNSIKNSVNIANEEHPEINSIKFFV